jgi:hypothetical protein
MSPAVLPLDVTSPVDTTREGFFKLPFELRCIIYDELLSQLQQEVKTTHQQLTIRYRPSRRPVQQISKEFAGEFNKRMKRLPLDSLTPKYEITQRNLVFVPEDQDWSLRPEQGIPHGSDVPFVLNLNIYKNASKECIGHFRQELRELLDWITGIVRCWHARLDRASRKTDSEKDDASSDTDSEKNDASSDTDSVTDTDDAPVVVCFWFCSMGTYEMFKPELEELWELTSELVCEGEKAGDIFIDKMGNNTKIEIMFYERDDFIAYPDAAAIARSRVVDTYTVADGWEGAAEDFTLAWRASRMQRFNSPELGDYEWWNLKRSLDGEDPESEEESSGEGVDSDGEP